MEMACIRLFHLAQVIWDLTEPTQLCQTINSKSPDTSEMSKNINEVSLDNLKHFEGKWKHGQTRTIRVPIALADATLDYARQLDNSIKSADTSDLSDKVNQLKDEPKKEKLGHQLKEVRSQLETVQGENEQLKVNKSAPEFELPEAADLLNKLKAKRKKSTTTLADVEKILEIIGG